MQLFVLYIDHLQYSLLLCLLIVFDDFYFFCNLLFVIDNLPTDIHLPLIKAVAL